MVTCKIQKNLNKGGKKEKRGKEKNSGTVNHILTFLTEISLLKFS